MNMPFYMPFEKAYLLILTKYHENLSNQNIDYKRFVKENSCRDDSTINIEISYEEFLLGLKNYKSNGLFVIFSCF